MNLDWLAAFAAALTRRPEIAGIVALAGIMAWMVRQKNQRNGGKIFTTVIHAQLAGIYLLGALAIVQSIGWKAVKIWGCP